MTICNACRYCEGYCAVFPAIELRRNFTKADLTYLANLCFDCRDCYYACQYAPPHEFAVNVPKLMAQLRTDTYREFTWPAIFSGLFRRNALAVTLVTLSRWSIILRSCWLSPGALTFSFAIHLGEGAFYRVVPFVAMTIPPRSWRSMDWRFSSWAQYVSGAKRKVISEVVGISALWRATKDAFGLTYMKGGGAGCNYPDANFSAVAPMVSSFGLLRFLLDFGVDQRCRFLRSFSRLASALSVV